MNGEEAGPDGHSLGICGHQGLPQAFASDSSSSSAWNRTSSTYEAQDKEKVVGESLFLVSRHGLAAVIVSSLLICLPEAV